MQRVVSFYEKLPRGPAPEVKATGLLGRYQARYFGKNPSAARKFFVTHLKHIQEYGDTDSKNTIALAHIIIGLLTIGYCNDYYFHLRMLIDLYWLMVANSL